MKSKDCTHGIIDRYYSSTDLSTKIKVYVQNRKKNF